MQIIISPAKKMRVDNDDIGAARLPVFLTKTEEILTALRALDYKGLQKLWQCNDAIAEFNYNRLQRMDLRRNLTPAVFSYDGLQYQHIAPNVFDEAALAPAKVLCFRLHYSRPLFWRWALCVWLKAAAGFWRQNALSVRCCAP